MNTIARAHDAGPQDLRTWLRTGTSDLHAHVDACFADGLGTRPAYARYLVGMHRFAADFEVVIGALPRHAYWLANDLRHLALAPLSPAGVVAHVRDADVRLGWEYVMAGSSLGARHLLRGVQARGFGEATGACFLSRHAACTDWRSVLDRLAARGGDDAPPPALLQGARDAFAHVQACFDRAFEIPFVDLQEPAA